MYHFNKFSIKKIFSKSNQVSFKTLIVSVFIMIAKIGVMPVFASFASDCYSEGQTLVLTSSECANRNGYNYRTNPENSNEICCSFDVSSEELYTLACTQREGRVISSLTEHSINDEVGMGLWYRSDYVCIKNSSSPPTPTPTPTPNSNPTSCSSTILQDLYQRCSRENPSIELAVILKSQCEYPCAITADDCDSCCCQVPPSEENFLIACQQAGGVKIIASSDLNTQIFTTIPIWNDYAKSGSICVKYNQGYEEGTCNYACSNVAGGEPKITTASNCSEFENQENGHYSYHIAELEECNQENKICCIGEEGGNDARYACTKLGGIVQGQCSDPNYPIAATNGKSDDCLQMVTDLNAMGYHCCLPENNTVCQNLPDDFSLNLNVNNLKFKSLLDMNPLQNSSVFSDPDSRTPGNIINQALTAVVFPIAGVGLIILILWGGFQVLSGSLSGKQNNIDLGKKRVTAAIVGFVLLFLIYWIWRLIALATGLSV